MRRMLRDMVGWCEMVDGDVVVKMVGLAVIFIYIMKRYSPLSDTVEFHVVNSL